MVNTIKSAGLVLQPRIQIMMSAEKVISWSYVNSGILPILIGNFFIDN